MDQDEMRDWCLSFCFPCNCNSIKISTLLYLSHMHVFKNAHDYITRDDSLLSSDQASC